MARRHAAFPLRLVCCTGSFIECKTSWSWTGRPIVSWDLDPVADLCGEKFQFLFVQLKPAVIDHQRAFVHAHPARKP